MYYYLTYVDQYGQWGDDTLFAYSEESAESMFSEAFPECEVLSVELLD